MCYFILSGRVCGVVVVVGSAAGAVEPVASSHTNISSDCDKNADTDTHTLWQINQRISERTKKKTYTKFFPNTMWHGFWERVDSSLKPFAWNMHTGKKKKKGKKRTEREYFSRYASELVFGLFRLVCVCAGLHFFLRRSSFFILSLVRCSFSFCSLHCRYFSGKFNSLANTFMIHI